MSAPQCVNLKQSFGDRFKVAYEESYHADRGEGAWAEDPWLLTIPARYGHFYPHDDVLIGFATDKCGGVARQLLALPFTRTGQDGDDGVSVIFDVEHFAEVAKIVKPHRKRQWTLEQRQQVSDRLSKYQFQPQ